MTRRSNEHGQPVGRPLPDWSPAKRPAEDQLTGSSVRLAPYDHGTHADGLFEATREDPTTWTYLSYGPFADAASFAAWASEALTGSDPYFYSWLVDDRPVGFSALMRIDPGHGFIEIGHVVLSPALRRTRAATEGFYLLLRHAFRDLGYRRVEWKCDDLNAPSRAAAGRLGFSYEGTFRDHLVTRGRNRDTAWYAMLATEWPEIEAGFLAWLDDANFDERGRQRRGLASCR